MQCFALLYQAAARPHRKPVRGRWRSHETYATVAGVACYVFRAIDTWGQKSPVFMPATKAPFAAHRSARPNWVNGTVTGVTPS